jgi:hypothetical protein
MDLTFRPRISWRKILGYPLDEGESSGAGLDVVAKRVIAAVADNLTAIMVPIY